MTQTDLPANLYAPLEHDLPLSDVARLVLDYLKRCGHPVTVGRIVADLCVADLTVHLAVNDLGARGLALRVGRRKVVAVGVRDDAA